MNLMPLLAALAGFSFNEKTGSIGAFGFSDGRSIATEIVGTYTMMSKSGDAEATEREDVVVKRTDGEDFVAFKCTNPKMPGIEIVKKYRAVNGGLRRTLAFRNHNDESRYVTPFVECHFADDFQDNLMHLGAGYVGPYVPFPKLPWSHVVNNYRQSSKGLVFVHPDGRRGDFAHYRVKIDETVVLPWWHSTIGHYREYHDRLTYLPDGYKMGLGTFGLYKDRIVSVTDQYTAYDGGLFGFFDKVFLTDPDIAKELKSIPPPPAWSQDVIAVAGADNDDFYIRWLTEMLDEGDIIPCLDGPVEWGDYSRKTTFHGFGGGVMTREEVAEIVRHYQENPRIHAHLYNIVISAGQHTPVIREHPLWHRIKDRDGNRDSLFPGFATNWQTMFNYPECRDWLVRNAFDFAEDVGLNVTYLDETQMTNTIDWEHDAVTRDDDTVKFWKAYVQKKHEKGILWFANGSGIPYADINFMECYYDLQPHLWREFCGVALGISLANRMRKGQRASLIYWTPHQDYANRVLAFGWIPRPIENLECVPVIRAVYEGGNLQITDAKYSPDWKTDWTTEIESYSMKREDAQDSLVSFINRKKEAADVAATVDLGSLGFGRDERVNVWRMHVDTALAGTNYEERLSDGELKANWKDRGIFARARITDPELVYSGKAEGEFRQPFAALGTNRIEQVLVTKAPLSIFAVDNLPANYFYTKRRHAAIDGRTVTCDRTTEVLIMEKGRKFSGITVNGAAASVRSVKVGGEIALLVRLEPGTWKLGWTSAAGRQSPVGEILPKAGEPGLTKVVKPTFGKMAPEEGSSRAVSVRHGSVTITAASTWHSTYEDGKFTQPKLPAAVMRADETNLVLEAGTSRKNVQTRWMQTYAGFEMSGVKQFRARFSHTFTEPKKASCYLNHYAPYDPGDPSEFFTGIIVDYSVKGEYVKRVSYATGLFHPKFCKWQPMWGRKYKPDECFDLGEWIEGPDTRVFSLDISRNAPEGWDGRIYLSLGTSHVMHSRSLKLEFLSFNDAKAGDFVTPTRDSDERPMPQPVKSKPLKVKPKSLAKIDVSEWKTWPKVPLAFRLGRGKPAKATTAHVAHDYDYLYVGYEAEEGENGPIVSNTDPMNNDHVETFVLSPGGDLLYQVMGDPKSQKALYLNGAQSSNTGKLVVRGAKAPDGRRWWVFFAIPVDQLKFDMQQTPVRTKVEFCRSVREPSECTSWSPLKESFAEKDAYGELILDFSW